CGAARGRRGERRAGPRAAGAREGPDRPVQVPAHRRVRRLAAEDRKRKDQARAAEGFAGPIRVASTAMPNRLAQETSPYLLQHKDNPVDWHPWGEEALARAREEDRPILLSIGYSACH